MRTFFRVMSGLALAVGSLLCLVGIAALPGGGLMFALPYVFLLPGVLLSIVGALGLFFTRTRPAAEPDVIPPA